MVFDTTILGSNPSAPAKLMKMLFKKNNFISKIKNKLFPFYKSKEIIKIFSILEKNKPNEINVAMFVGGCVRKYLKNEKIDDIDVATIFSPDQIIKKFEKENIRVIETGSDHGTVTLLYEGKIFELTTLRKDIETDGRHAKVSFTDDWIEDSKRRDFTINSIYMDQRGKIFDPQSGLLDLKNNNLKFIGDPSERITEDYLRIIRFIRFSIQYNCQSDLKVIESIKLNLNGIKNISKERILSEFYKILELKNFKNIINNKNLLDIFLLIFPEIRCIERIKKISLITENLSLKKDLLLAIIVMDNSNNHEYFCHKYKVSNNTRLFLNSCAKFYEDFKKDDNFFKKNLKKKLYFNNKEIIKDFNTFIFFVNNNISYKEYKMMNLKIDNQKLNIFSYNGEYLKKKGIKEGKTMGAALKELEKYWVENDFVINSETERNIIKKFKN